MTLADWLLGKPRLVVSGGKRGPSLLVRLWRSTPFWDPVSDADFRTQVREAYNEAAFGSYGPSIEPTKDGEQIRRYGQFLGGGFETITAVGDSCLVDSLGSDYRMYYVRKDTFEDFPAQSVWLVNVRNQYYVELVLYECVGCFTIAKSSIRIGDSNRYMQLSDLDGQPWDRELLRQSGIDIPV